MASVFHLAILEGDVTKVRFLLKYSPGLRVDSVNKLGLTALQQAALDGNVDMVNFLLERGADLSCVDTEGRTALHFASQEGHLGVVSLLVTSACANVNAKTKQGYKAIDLAKTDQVRALLSQAMLTESFKRKCSLDEDDFDAYLGYRNIPGCRNSLSSASTDSGVYDDSCSSQDSAYDPKFYRSNRVSSLRGYPTRYSMISEQDDSRGRSESVRVTRTAESPVNSILKSNSFSGNIAAKESIAERNRAEMQRYKRPQPKAYVRDARRRRTVTFGLTEKERETERAETPVEYCGSYGIQNREPHEGNTTTRTITRQLPPVPPRVPPRVKSPPVPAQRTSPRSSPPIPSPRSTPSPSPRPTPRASPPPVPSPRSPPNTSPRMPPQNPPLVTPRSALTPRSASLKVRGEPEGCRVVPRRPRSEFERGRDVPNRRSCHAGFSSRGIN